MLVQGTVMSFSPSVKVKKQGGGQYDAWELAYRSTENEVKTLVKPVQSLRFNPSLKISLEQLIPGDDFTALLEKNPNGFFDVKSVEKGIKEMVDSPKGSSTAAEAASPARSGRITGSNYETAEERAKRQVVIVRQSTINAAIEALQMMKLEAPANQADVLELAKEFEKHVMKDLEKAASKYMEVAPKVE